MYLCMCGVRPALPNGGQSRLGWQEGGDVRVIGGRVGQGEEP